MSDTSPPSPPPPRAPLPDFDLPPPNIRAPKRWRLSLIWLVPAVAVFAGAVLAVRSYIEAGPAITITFDTAEGLDTGKTAVRFKNVDIGKVRRIELSEDHSHVIVTVDLVKEAARLAVQDTRFWVVRPRVDFGGVSGLNTLLSGAYIGIDVGKSGEERRHFEGLEKPPAITNDQKGRRFVLHADDLGSLNIGSPVYYRRLPVGSVAGFDLNPDGRGVTLQVFIEAPYDAYVRKDARFWNASGVELAIGASGLKLNTESLATVLAGGLAFQSLDENAQQAPADADAEFQVFADQTAALAQPGGALLPVRMRFRQSAKGLEAGAPVEFQGIKLGEIKTVELHYDTPRKEFYVDVKADLYPERLGPAWTALRNDEHGQRDDAATIFRDLIHRGLRAETRVGNILTEQLYIALDFKPGTPVANVDLQATPLEIPTAAGSIQQAQQQVLDILKKLDAIPFDQIGLKVRDLLTHTDSVMQQLDGKLAPEAAKMLEDARRTLQSADRNLVAPDAPVQQDTRRTMEQLQQAARSLRALADYLQRHPQSLLRGRADETIPAAEPAPATPETRP